MNNTQMSKMSPQVKWLLAKDNPVEEQEEQQQGTGRTGLIRLTKFLSLSHDVSQLVHFTSFASASTGAAKCVKHTALLEYNAVLCGQMLGRISCITAFGAQIPLTGITGDHP